jgi:hypothetical protein
MKKSLAVGATSLLLAGCQTWGPTWTEVTGARFDDMASMTIGPVLINLIDGSSPLQGGPRQPIKVTPGKHTMQLQAVPPDPVMGRIALEEITVELQPCMRYYINARFSSSTSTEWRPFIDKAEGIAGCQVTPPGKG